LGAGVELDPAGGPDRALTTNARKTLVDRRQEPHQLEPRISPARHGGRAGVILLANDRETVLPDRDNGGDDTDFERGTFERVALLDMGFEERCVAGGLDDMARTAGPAGLAERLAHRLSGGRIDR